MSGQIDRVNIESTIGEGGAKGLHQFLADVEAMNDQKPATSIPIRHVSKKRRRRIDGKHAAFAWRLE